MAIRGSKGETTNRSVPITNIVSQPIASAAGGPIAIILIRSRASTRADPKGPHYRPPSVVEIFQLRKNDCSRVLRLARGLTSGAVISVTQRFRSEAEDQSPGLSR